MSLPYDYVPLVMGVIKLLGEGRTLTHACRVQQISVGTYKSYVTGNPELEKLHDEALQLGYDTMAEILVGIDSDPVYGSSDSRMAKVISDNIKWLLERRKPREYGNHVSVDVNITADRAITDALTRARDRALGGTPAIELIAGPVDAVFSEVVSTVGDATEEELFLASIGAG